MGCSLVLESSAGDPSIGDAAPSPRGSDRPGSGENLDVGPLLLPAPPREESGGPSLEPSVTPPWTRPNSSPLLNPPKDKAFGWGKTPDPDVFLLLLPPLRRFPSEISSEEWDRNVPPLIGLLEPVSIAREDWDR